MQAKSVISFAYLRVYLLWRSECRSAGLTTRRKTLHFRTERLDQFTRGKSPLFANENPSLSAASTYSLVSNELLNTTRWPTCNRRDSCARLLKALTVNSPPAVFPISKSYSIAMPYAVAENALIWGRYPTSKRAGLSKLLDFGAEPHGAEFLISAPTAMSAQRRFRPADDLSKLPDFRRIPRVHNS